MVDFGWIPLLHRTDYLVGWWNIRNSEAVMLVLTAFKIRPLKSLLQNPSLKRGMLNNLLMGTIGVSEPVRKVTKKGFNV